MTTPFDQYGLTPEQVQAAIAQSGGTFQLPGASAMGGGAPVGVDVLPILNEPEPQPLSMNAQGMLDARSLTPAAPPPMSLNAQGLLDANPGLRSVSPGPGAQPAPPQTQLRPPTVNPYARDATPAPRVGGGGGGGLRNPLPEMERDARARAASAEQGFDQAAVDYDTGIARQEQAAEDTGQARSDAAQQLAGIDREASFDIAGREELHEARVKAFEESTAKTQEEMQALSDQVANGKPKDSRSGVQKAVSLIAIALGGIGRGFELAAGNMNARNTALDLVQAGIERDMEQQREMLANKRTALAAKQTELSMAREMFGATEQADRAAYLMRLERYERDVQAAKNEGLSKEAIGAADSLIGQLQEKRAGLGLELYGKRLEQNRSQADQLAVAQWQDQQRARAAQQKAAQAQDPRLPGGLVVQDPVIYQRLSEKQRGEVLTAVEAREKAAQALGDIQRLRAAHPVARGFDGSLLKGGVESEASKRIRSASARYTTAIKDLEALGALDTGTMELTSQITGDPNTWSDDSDGVIADVQSGLARDTGKYLRNRGVSIGAGSANSASAEGQAASQVRPGAAR